MKAQDDGRSPSKTHTQDKQKKSLFDLKWTVRVFLLSFAISVVLALGSEAVTEGLDVLVCVPVLVLFILVGILFDIIGISVATADESVFNAMATKNVKGARCALWFLTRSAVVANICNDVIGDICGVLCGTLSGVIALGLSSALSTRPLLTTVLVTSFTSAFIVGGKALFKQLAMKKSNDIVFFFARGLCAVLPEKMFKKKKR